MAGIAKPQRFFMIMAIIALVCASEEIRREVDSFALESDEMIAAQIFERKFQIEIEALEGTKSRANTLAVVRTPRLTCVLKQIPFQFSRILIRHFLSCLLSFPGGVISL